MMKLSELINTPLKNDPEILGLAIDSRQVHPGYLFCAYKGYQQDGSIYIPDAIAKGAAAIITDQVNPVVTNSNIPAITIKDLQQKLGDIASRFFNFPAKKMRIIGVTGTNGKTSCTHFLAACLQQHNIPSAVIGTLGNGLYGAIVPSSLTTPDAVSLQSVFADLVRQGAQAVAMEVSSHSLDQGRVNGIEFEIGTFTNLSRDHLDYHKTMEAYGQAKKKLFEFPLKYAVINGDDSFGREIIESFNKKNNMFVYGFQPETKKFQFKNYVYAESNQFTSSGMTSRIVTPWGESDLHINMIGKFNLSNVLATITSLCLYGFTLQEAVQSVSKLNAVSGRMQMFGGKDKPLVVVDYAHTPDALEKVLMALREHCEGQLYCLFGCGGDRDRGKRPMMAEIAETYADQVIVTDDNPRTEESVQIVSDILKGFTNPNRVIVEHNRSKAIKDIIQYAQPGDCVLIAGKGAERYQIIGVEKIPFNDIDEVNRCLT